MKKGFTLLELLVVMVIVAVISAVALPSFLSMGQGMALRGATANIKSTLSLARQWAITHRTDTYFTYITTTTNTALPYSEYFVDDGSVTLTQTNRLPAGIIMQMCWKGTWQGHNAPHGTGFNTTGGLNEHDDPQILIKISDAHKPDVYNTITLNWLTGSIRVE